MASYGREARFEAAAHSRTWHRRGRRRGCSARRGTAAWLWHAYGTRTRCRRLVPIQFQAAPVMLRCGPGLRFAQPCRLASQASRRARAPVPTTPPLGRECSRRSATDQRRYPIRETSVRLSDKSSSPPFPFRLASGSLERSPRWRHDAAYSRRLLFPPLPRELYRHRTSAMHPFRDNGASPLWAAVPPSRRPRKNPSRSCPPMPAPPHGRCRSRFPRRSRRHAQTFERRSATNSADRPMQRQVSYCRNRARRASADQGSPPARSGP